jgi:hypothetical protein
MLEMLFQKLNRRRKSVVYRTDEKGKRRVAMVVMYDDLSKAKKPPAWMKELIFSDGTEKAS